MAALVPQKALAGRPATAGSRAGPPLEVRVASEGVSAAARDVRNAASSAARVIPGLYVGGYVAAADPRAPSLLGVTRIVKLFADDDAYPGGFHRHPGVAYLVFPAKDSPDYDIRPDAMRALRFIHEGLAAGGRVLVHCHAGISRSVTVVLLYLMVHRGLDLEAALRLVRAVRPFARPNVGFLAHLRAIDARLGRLRAQ